MYTSSRLCAPRELKRCFAESTLGEASGLSVTGEADTENQGASPKGRRPWKAGLRLLGKVSGWLRS
jgi:hypothetical protein